MKSLKEQLIDRVACRTKFSDYEVIQDEELMEWKVICSMEHLYKSMFKFYEEKDETNKLQICRSDLFEIKRIQLLMKQVMTLDNFD